MNKLKTLAAVLVTLICISVLSQLPKPLPAQAKLSRSTSVVIKEHPEHAQQHILSMSHQGWRVVAITSYLSPYQGGTPEIIIVMEK